MEKFLVACLIFTLFGCAQLKIAAEDTDTFAICKAADVATTGYALSTRRFVEKNPLVAPFVSNGVMPLALVSFVIWRTIAEINAADVTMAMNAVTCPVAAHNLWLLM